MKLGMKNGESHKQNDQGKSDNKSKYANVV